MPLRRLILPLLVAVLVAAGLALPLPAGAQSTTTSASTSVTTLDWRSCRGGFECATLTVPWDDAAPEGPTVDLALLRRPAADPSRRIGSLVLNPGGPGGSAVEFVRAIAGQLPDELQDRFDIVGFDPRGSGESDPVECGYDMAELYALDFSPDDQPERDRLVAGTQEFVDACVAANGDYLRHVSTDDTVRDLEKVRIALGDDALTFLGYSYGTYIGAKYAEAYPDKVRALVLDGAVDPSISSKDMQVEQAAGFEGVLDGFLSWCGKHRQCAFHRDGRTAKAFDALAARIDRDGLRVPGTSRTLSGTEFELGVGAIGYEGRAGYEYLGEALDAADAGDGTALAELSDSYTERNPDGSYGSIQDAFLAISCADGPTPGTVADVAAIEAAAAEAAPRTGPGIVNNSLACALWPFPGKAAAPVSAPTAPPIVVVGTRRDPATPFAWARSLVAQLGGDAVLISAPGAQHTSFGLGNPCVDGAVTRYLVDLEAPTETLVCK